MRYCCGVAATWNFVDGIQSTFDNSGETFIMQNPNDKQNTKRVVSTAEYVALTLTLVPAIIAVSLVTYNVTIVSTPDLLPIWIALPAGSVMGIFALSIFGGDTIGTIIGSVVIIIVSLFLLPVAPRIKAQRLRKEDIVPTQIQRSPRVQPTTR